MDRQPGEEVSDDARTTLRMLANELRRALLDVTWRQWGAMGAGAAVAPPRRKSSKPAPPRRELETLIDPEGLVLVSLVLFEQERRLADLLHDWSARNSDLLSVQRMNNLAAQYPEPLRPALHRRLTWFASVASEVGKDLRWRSLAREGGEAAKGFDVPGEGGSVSATLDKRASGRQATTEAARKSRAARARLSGATTLLLRLRLGLGVGVKSDLLSYLLCHETGWETVRAISRATGYTGAAVRRAIDDLAAARFIEAREDQPASYRAEYSAWAPLLALERRPPRWGYWHERFIFSLAFLHWAEEVGERPLSAYAFGVRGRELLEQHHAAFERDQLARWSAHTPITDWGDFTTHALRALIAWMDRTALRST